MTWNLESGLAWDVGRVIIQIFLAGFAYGFQPMTFSGFLTEGSAAPAEYAVEGGFQGRGICDVTKVTSAGLCPTGRAQTVKRADFQRAAGCLLAGQSLPGARVSQICTAFTQHILCKRMQSLVA